MLPISPAEIMTASGKVLYRLPNYGKGFRNKTWEK